MNTNRKNKPWDYFILFLKGRLVYAFGILPFSDVSSFRRTLNADGDRKKDALLNPKGYLFSSWSYYLGGAIASLLIFSVPFSWLNTNFHYARTIGIGLFILPFLILSVLRFFKEDHPEKEDLIRSAILFVLTLAVCLSMMFIKEPVFENDMKSSLFILMGFFTIGFFFLTFSGIGTTSLFYISSTLLPISNRRREGVYQGLKTRILYSFCLLLSRFIGSRTGYLAKNRTEAKPEQESRKASFLLSGLIYCFAFQLKGEIFNQYTTETAQKITLICVPMAFFFIAVILVLPQLAALFKGKKKACA